MGGVEQTDTSLLFKVKIAQYAHDVNNDNAAKMVYIVNEKKQNM